MRVLGVDPGIAVTGYGLVEGKRENLTHLGDGLILTPSSLSFPKRVFDIGQFLERIIQEFQPEILAIENLYFAKNIKSAIQLGKLHGGIIWVAVKAGLKVHEYSPSEVKQSVVGYGMAEKAQVRHMVKSLLNLEAFPKLDASDALAVAICHIMQNPLLQPKALLVG